MPFATVPGSSPSDGFQLHPVEGFSSTSNQTVVNTAFANPAISSFTCALASFPRHGNMYTSVVLIPAFWESSKFTKELLSKAPKLWNARKTVQSNPAFSFMHRNAPASKPGSATSTPSPPPPWAPKEFSAANQQEEKLTRHFMVVRNWVERGRISGNGNVQAFRICTETTDNNELLKNK